MAVWTLTKSEIKDSIETTARRLSKTERLTYLEIQIIDNAVNAAMIDVCLEYGVTRWRFMQGEYTVDTVANQQYVDLDTSIFKVITGTVRIIGDATTLTMTSLEAIRSGDPGEQTTGRPERYAFDDSGTASTIRLELWPIPDAVYTITYQAEAMVDEDSVSSFPGWMHAAVKDKASERALRDLGFFSEALHYRAAYQKALHAAKAAQGDDTPVVVRRVGGYRTPRLEARLPSS